MTCSWCFCSEALNEQTRIQAHEWVLTTISTGSMITPITAVHGVVEIQIVIIPI